MKKDAWKKDVLICQNHDESLNFAGDSGAVGTFFYPDRHD